ncbi:MAG: hypothetical protein K0R94_1672, partial [Burkholderiales bacterium]|nr:hypothetical protein [Burkholderiales bacterium]
IKTISFQYKQTGKGLKTATLKFDKKIDGYKAIGVYNLDSYVEENLTEFTDCKIEYFDDSSITLDKSDVYELNLTRQLGVFYENSYGPTTLSPKHFDGKEKRLDTK